MGETVVIEGSTEEILIRLQEAYPAQNLRVTIEPQEDLEEDLLAGMPPPPNTIRSEAHLIELLLEGLNGSPHEVTDEIWEQRKADARRRAASRQ